MSRPQRASASRLSEWLASKRPQINSGKDMKERKDLCAVSGDANWCSCCGTQYGDSSKTKNRATYDSVILLLGICPKKMKTLLWKDTCTPMFIAALFTTAKIWKQSKCPPRDEWIKMMWYTHNSQDMKTTRVSANRWVDKEDVIHTQTQTHTHTHTHTHRHTHTEILFSHEKEGNLPFATTWMNLEGIVLSKISRTEDRYCMISLICGI